MRIGGFRRALRGFCGVPANLTLAAPEILAPRVAPAAREAALRRPPILVDGVLPPVGQLALPSLALQARVVNFGAGEAAAPLALRSDVWAQPPRPDVLQQVVRWYRAGLRAGNASTKSYSEKRGSGRKLYQQKGSGRARAGNVRAPQRRGGVKTHGPKPRDWAYPLNKKIRNLGLRVALSAKLREDKLVLVDTLEMGSHKTAAMQAALEKLGVLEPSRPGRSGSGVLLVGVEALPNPFFAARNLPNVDYCAFDEVSVYELLRRRSLVMEREAAEKLQEWLMKEYEQRSDMQMWDPALVRPLA